ncbi:MAG: ATPase, partial [Candidatus Dormibacteraeota bacterium]|nr:ATPase [Candidatus Dormibacteraeota bacterium]
ARVLALSDGRAFATPEDVRALAVPVLAHRLMLTPEAELRGRTAAEVVGDVLQSVPVPASGRS